MMFWKRWRAKKNPERSWQEGELNFVKSIEYYSGYSTQTTYVLCDVDDVVNDYRNNQTSNYVYVTTNYNGKLYPMFDLDVLNKYNDFVRNFKEEKYVMFQSSPGHYWAIVDREFNSFNDFTRDPLINDWIVYTDKQYNDFTRYRKYFSCRGYFDEMNRQPVIIDKSDNLSNNFNEFINKFDNYLQTTALELSMLKYRKPDMLNLYKRQRKLERILK